MASRKNCDAILEVIETMHKGICLSVDNISEEHLNHSFAEHKMTIGQIAVHTMAWPTYFLSDPKPWEVEKWTCCPCEYPLTLDFVAHTIEQGRQTMVEKLLELDDDLLEVNEKGEKGLGYLFCRLQLDTLVHANQIAYLRDALDVDWKFGGWFGNMATAYIRLPYYTEQDLTTPGF